MKTPICWTCLFVLLLTACNTSPQGVGVTPAITTVEVTRIVQVTTTPIPTLTRTPAATLDETEKAVTAIAEKIGTPIVASDECYETAQSQRDLNDCAAARFAELENHTAALLKILETYYQERFPDGLEKFQNYHAEWEDFSDRECRTRSGLDGEGSPGSMAPMNYGECLISKYEDRLREYQIEIFGWTN